MLAQAALALALVVVPLAAPAAADNHVYGECHAIAPFEPSCTVRVLPTHNSTVQPVFRTAFSGTLDIVARQNGVAIWNATCIVPLGLRVSNGVGLCFPDDPDPPLYQHNVWLEVTVSVGTAGAGTYGVRVYY